MWSIFWNNTEVVGIVLKLWLCKKRSWFQRYYTTGLASNWPRCYLLCSRHVRNRTYLYRAILRVAPRRLPFHTRTKCPNRVTGTRRFVILADYPDAYFENCGLWSGVVNDKKVETTGARKSNKTSMKNNSGWPAWYPTNDPKREHRRLLKDPIVCRQCSTRHAPFSSPWLSPLLCSKIFS